MSEQTKSGPSGVVFVLLYIPLMLATYILPWAGSNSTLIQGINAAATSGDPKAHIMFYLHAGSIILLCALTYWRGTSNGKKWIVIFPILEGLFDLVPGLSLIPLVPTVMHICALVMGARGGNISTVTNAAMAAPQEKETFQSKPNLGGDIEVHLTDSPPQKEVATLVSTLPAEIATPAIRKNALAEEGKDIPIRTESITVLAPQTSPTQQNKLLILAIFTLAAAIVLAGGFYFFRPGNSSQNSDVTRSPASTSAPSNAVLIDQRSFKSPDVRVGNVYRYVKTNLDENKPAQIVDRKIIGIDEGTIIVGVYNPDSDTYTRRTFYDYDWNYKGSEGNNGSQDFSPSLKYFDFPIFSGKSWGGSAVETLRPSMKTKTHRIIAEVKEIDMIDVPAGRFEAIHIVINLTTMDGDKRLETIDHSWYSPQIGRTVKSELTTLYPSTGKIERRLVQLQSFQKGKD